MTDCLVILNTKAGTAPEGPDAETGIGRAFASAGARAVIIRVAPAEVEKAVRDGMTQHREVIFVGGGDGTLATAARCLLGSSTALGVLPLGTRNHFARDLHIPLAVDEAVKSLLGGRPVAVDLGAVNGVPFINNVSIGLYPLAVRQRDANRRRIGISKGAAMAYAILNVLWRYPMHRLHLSWDGGERTLLTPFVLVGNNEYVTSAGELGSRRSLRDGQLSAYHAHRIGRARLLWTAFAALFGVMGEAPELQGILTPHLVVGSRHRHLEVAIDGEIRTLQTPLDFRVCERALRVLAPRPAS